MDISGGAVVSITYEYNFGVLVGAPSGFSYFGISIIGTVIDFTTIVYSVGVTFSSVVVTSTVGL